MKKNLGRALALALLGLVSQPEHSAAESPRGFVTAYAKAASVSEDLAQQQVSALFGALTDELKAGREVSVRNFGKFSVKQREARKGRNPKTGAALDIPAKRYPRFTASDSLKNGLN